MEKPKKSRKWIWIVLLIVAVLCVAGALGLFYVFSQPLFGAVGPTYTSDMKIAITSAKITGSTGGEVYFIVPANTDLTLQNNDKKSHNCVIAGNGQPVSIPLSGGNVSSPFQLPEGSYRLTCDNNPNRFVSVTAQKQ